MKFFRENRFVFNAESSDSVSSSEPKKVPLRPLFSTVKAHAAKAYAELDLATSASVRDVILAAEKEDNPKALIYEEGIQQQQKELDEVKQEFIKVLDGATRETPWEQSSSPTKVSASFSANYYDEFIESGSSSSAISIDVAQVKVSLHEEVGTIINDALEENSIGGKNEHYYLMVLLLQKFDELQTDEEKSIFWQVIKEEEEKAITSLGNPNITEAETSKMMIVVTGLNLVLDHYNGYQGKPVYAVMANPILSNFLQSRDPASINEDLVALKNLMAKQGVLSQTSLALQGKLHQFDQIIIDVINDVTSEKEESSSEVIVVAEDREVVTKKEEEKVESVLGDLDLKEKNGEIVTTINGMEVILSEGGEMPKSVTEINNRVLASFWKEFNLDKIFATSTNYGEDFARGFFGVGEFDDGINREEFNDLYEMLTFSKKGASESANILPMWDMFFQMAIVESDGGMGDDAMQSLGCDLGKIYRGSYREGPVHGDKNGFIDFIDQEYNLGLTEEIEES